MANAITRAREAVLTVAVVAATAAAIVSVGLRMSAQADSSTLQVTEETIAEWREYAVGGLQRGNQAAPVVIVEFSDFRCPVCRGLSKGLETVFERYPDQVRLVYRHYPADLISANMALAAECAARQGAFRAAHDQLFGMDSLPFAGWQTFAARIGVRDTARFVACQRDSSMRAVVLRDMESAQALGIHGTPLILVNDRLLRGYPGPDRLDALVKQVIP